MDFAELSLSAVYLSHLTSEKSSQAIDSESKNAINLGFHRIYDFILSRQYIWLLKALS